MNRIKVTRDGLSLFNDIGHATNFWQRLCGLLLTARLSEYEIGVNHSDTVQGLLISPCSRIHTMGMKYPIDVIFLSRENRVLKVVEQLVPFRMAGYRSACHVLEVAAGSVALHSIKPSDWLNFETL